MNEYEEKYQDTHALIKDVTGQIMISIHANPTMRLGIALGYPQAESVPEAVAMWVEEFWTHYSALPPASFEEYMNLSERMAFDVNQMLTDFYGGYSWQHCPEYPEL